MNSIREEPDFKEELDKLILATPDSFVGAKSEE